MRTHFPAWVSIVALTACAAPAILVTESPTYPRPVRCQIDAHGAITYVARGESLCCPDGFAAGGTLDSDCLPNQRCPIWEGMGTPRPMASGPVIVPMR